MNMMRFFFSSLLSFFHFGLLLIHVLTITRKPFLMVTLTSRTPHMVLFLVHVISVISVFTAVTTNTRPQRVFLLFKPAFWWTSINRYHGFSLVGLEKILSPFLEHSEEYVGVSAVLQYFAARSDTASCQDYKEKEFVECFSEETQIIDIFTHCKLQPHKLSKKQKSGIRNRSRKRNPSRNRNRNRNLN